MAEWYKIRNIEDINYLLRYYGGFHDSCIKELRYLSGMGVNEDMAMLFGESKDRQVEIIFQRQWAPTTVELRFTGMRIMNIAGWQRYYASEIIDG